MMRALTICAGLGLAAGGLVAQETPRPPSISAAGSVDVLLPPDRASLVLIISGEGIDIGSAAGAVDSAATGLLRLAQQRGLTVVPWAGAYAENVAVRRMMPGQMDVRTTRDYLARRGIVIEVPDAAETGAVLNELVALRFSGSINILYNVDEGHSELRFAHTKAVAIARERAVVMAEGLGGELGELISIATMPGYMQQPLHRFQIHDGMTPPLQPSDVIYRVSITGVWEFVDK